METVRHFSREVSREPTDRNINLPQTTSSQRISGCVLVLVCVVFLLGSAEVGPSPSWAASTFLDKQSTRHTNCLTFIFDGNCGRMENSLAMNPAVTVDVPTQFIQQRASGLVKLLQEQQWLSACHLTDFFVKDLWSILPGDWRQFLETLSIPDALEAASCAGDTGSMHSFLAAREGYPNTLAHFLNGLAGLPLSREPVGINKEHKEGLGLGAALERGMTPKKMHEVERLAARVAQELSSEEGPRPTIVDVGSGLGHLSRVLAIKYGFNVLAVEGDSCHVQTAIQVDRKKTKRKQMGSAASVSAVDAAQDEQHGNSVAASTSAQAKHGWVRHVHFRFGGVGGGQSLVDAVRPLLAAEAALSARNSDSGEQQPAAASRDFVLVGLHACGDLVPQMLEAFKACDDCKAVFAVSCCYMKVSATGAKPSEPLQPHPPPSSAPDLPAAKRPATSSAPASDTPSAAGEGGPGATQYLGAGGGVVPFPMSSSVRKDDCPLGDPESGLGYHMREQACHALEAWTGRAGAEAGAAREILAGSGGRAESLWGVEAMPLSLRNHCWRAVLEKILSEVASRAPAGWRGGQDSLRRCLQVLAEGEDGKRGRLAGVNREKVHRHGSFASYARAVLRRASAAPEGAGRARDWVDEEVARLMEADLDAEYAALLKQWHRPVLFYALRLALAPAIESLLLLDRLLFLREVPRASSALLPAFRPGLSPRTFLLAAVRRGRRAEDAGEQPHGP